MTQLSPGIPPRGVDEPWGGGHQRRRGLDLLLQPPARRQGCQDLRSLVLCVVRRPLRLPLLPDVLEVVHLPALVLDAGPAAAGLLGRVDDLLAVDRPGRGVVEDEACLDRPDLADGKEVALEGLAEVVDGENLKKLINMSLEVWTDVSILHNMV